MGECGFPGADPGPDRGTRPGDSAMDFLAYDPSFLRAGGWANPCGSGGNPTPEWGICRMVRRHPILLAWFP
jgi:hypothetical protein